MMKEVLLEWYDGSDGRLLKTEVTGAIEGSEIYKQIGCLCNPHLQDWVKESDIPYGAHYLLVKEKVSFDDLAKIKLPGQSLSDLISRHKEVNTLEKKTMIEKALKLSEETGEVAEAVCSYMDVAGCGYKNKTEADVVEESLDVVIMALSIAFSTSMSDREIRDIMLKKIDKWESKIK